MRCLLIGNYGVGNLGDEALKDYFLTRFPDIEWTVLSASPRTSSDVPRLPFGLRSLFTPWWNTLRAFRASDAVVFGGGSLFTDVESVYACMLWWWHARIARLFGKPVILAFQGIGPFKTSVGEWCARDVISRAAFVSVRDEESGERVKKWTRLRQGFGGQEVESGKWTEVFLTADPVLSLLEGSSQTSGLAIALIPRANSGDDFLAQAMSVVERDPSSVVIISMQVDSSDERSFCLSLKEAIGVRAAIHVVQSLHELSAQLSRSSRVVTARYHGALAALALGIPVDIIAQHPGDKLDALRTIQGTTGIEELQRLVQDGERELLKYLNML